MKRFILLVCSAFLLGAMTLSAASGSAGKKVKWHLSRDGVLTFSGVGPMKNFGGSTPYYGPLVKSVEVEDGVTSVGANAFKEFTELTSVRLPSTLKYIGKSAFEGCRNLPDVVLPFGLDSIAERAFKGCRKFIAIEMPVTMHHVGKEAFLGCTNLSFAQLSSQLNYVAPDAFKDCELLSELDNLPAFITMDNYHKYNLARTAVKNFWEKKARIAASYGNDGEVKGSVAQANAQSEVDLDIPFSGLNNENTFVVVIANENYSKLADVPFAVNDGKTFAEYCRLTLGVPANNIRLYQNASYGVMREALSNLKMINGVVGDKMKVIFYYAGHGAPDDATLEPYIVPVDAARVNKDVCLPMADVYRELGELKSRSVTVFLDACFSGATRGGGMIASARGIARAPKKGTLSGNVAVLSATSGDQTAMPYNDKGHGMFTFYLLKKLKDSKGSASLDEIRDYVSVQVARQSTIVNRKEQTPTFLTSPGVDVSWREWHLND